MSYEMGWQICNATWLHFLTKSKKQQFHEMKTILMNIVTENVRDHLLRKFDESWNYDDFEQDMHHYLSKIDQNKQNISQKHPENEKAHVAVIA